MEILNCSLTACPWSRGGQSGEEGWEPVTRLSTEPVRVSQKPEISNTQGSFLKVTREARWESKQEQPNLGLVELFLLQW